MIATLKFIVRIGRRFPEERLAQTAAALSFSTLLGLVPMIVVAAALLDHLPFSSAIGKALEDFLVANLLPEKAGAVIAKAMGRIADRAHQLTIMGVVVLGATAVMQMLTIEHAFNAIWRVRKARPLYRRLAIHLLALILGPLLFGASLAATTYLAGASLGLVSEPRWVTRGVFGMLSFVAVAGLVGLIYWGVPSRDVAIRHAAVGGLLSALGFIGLQRLFSAYVISIPTYTMVYGAFWALPVFLTWLYASWTIVLIGALIVAELSLAAGR